MLIDRGSQTLYINTGTLASPTWEPISGGIHGAIEVRNATGVTIEDGDLVYISGWDETEGLPKISLADADAQGSPAEYVIRTDILTGANGLAHKTYRETGGVDLAGKAVGDPLYLSTTAGDATVTDPTDGDPNGLSQIVGRVAVVATDVTEYNLSNPLVQIGTNELQDSAVTSAKIVDGGVATADLANDAVTGRKIVTGAIGEYESAAVTVTHGGGTPQEILAADANNDRVVAVLVVGAIAATGDPDVNIGTENDLSSVVDDFKAGAWAVGDRHYALIPVPAGENIRATVAAGSAGTLDVYTAVTIHQVSTANLRNDAVTGRKIINQAIGAYEAAAVTVTHDGGTPQEILAADASNDRIALVWVVGAIAATGAPDVNIGTENDLSSVVDDYLAGAWAVGDRHLAIIPVPANENIRATVAAGTTGTLDVFVSVVIPQISAANLRTDAVTGVKIPNLSLGTYKASAVVLDHNDGSPKELLAADANNDRIVAMWLVATQAAGGAPDIDIGSAGSTASAFEDIGGGTWVIGDRYFALIPVEAAGNVRATIAAAGSAGTFDVFISTVTLAVSKANIGADSIDETKMDMSLPITLSLPFEVGTRVGPISDGVLLGVLTRQAIDACLVEEDGSGFTDETIDINDADASDVALTDPFSTSDSIHFGMDNKFTQVVIQIGTAGSGDAVAAETLWEYSKGSDTWGSLEAVEGFEDSTVALEAGTSTYVISFLPPADWATDTINALGPHYWIRMRATADAVYNTTSPLLTQGWACEVSVGQGIVIPMAGTISAVDLTALTVSATNDDSEFLLINITTGLWEQITWTGADQMDRVTGLALVVSAGDQVVLQQITEDGSTEFADCMFILQLDF